MVFVVVKIAVFQDFDLVLVDHLEVVRVAVFVVASGAAMVFVVVKIAVFQDFDIVLFVDLDNFNLLSASRRRAVSTGPAAFSCLIDRGAPRAGGHGATQLIDFAFPFCQRLPQALHFLVCVFQAGDKPRQFSGHLWRRLAGEGLAQGVGELDEVGSKAGSGAEFLEQGILAFLRNLEHIGASDDDFFRVFARGAQLPKGLVDSGF